MVSFSLVFLSRPKEKRRNKSRFSFVAFAGDLMPVVLSDANSRGRSIRGLCEQMRYLTTHDAAIIEEKSLLQYETLHKCIDSVRPEKKTKGYNPDNLRITSEPIRSTSHAWAFTPATPFWKAIDVNIGYLQNGGFILKWTKDALLEINSKKKIAYSKNNMVEDKEADMVTYGCSFVLYTIGNIIATIVFVIERFAREPSNRSKNIS